MLGRFGGVGRQFRTVWEDLNLINILDLLVWLSSRNPDCICWRTDLIVSKFSFDTLNTANAGASFDCAVE